MERGTKNRKSHFTPSPIYYGNPFGLKISGKWVDAASTNFEKLAIIANSQDGRINYAWNTTIDCTTPETINGTEPDKYSCSSESKRKSSWELDLTSNTWHWL